MQSYVREQLRQAVRQAQQEGAYTAEDLLRTFTQEATLMFQTEHVTTMLRSDPFEHLQDIAGSIKERLCPMLQITEYENVLTQEGHCRIAATVTLSPDDKMRQVGAVSKYVQLYFLYERDGTRHAGEQTSVWYAIDVARDDGPREKILWVKVFAAGSVPSGLPAQNLDDGHGDEDDGWEDIDDEDDDDDDDGKKDRKNRQPDDDESTEQAESKLKKARLSEDEDQEMKEKTVEAIIMDNDDDNDAAPLADRFTAGIDPDALSQFWQWACLQETSEATSFFLLMTFPFYEMEFDLPGFILDAVFGAEDADGDDNDAE